MKKTGKLLALGLSAVMLFSTSLSAIAAPPSMPPGSNGGGANTMTYDYSGTLSGKLTANGESVSANGEIYSSTESDVNTALSQNGGTLEIAKTTLNKSGSDEDGDSCNFYGVNSIALATGEDSELYISESELSADSTGSNGIFATDSATAYSYNNTITTTLDNSRGLDATYDGTIIADKTTISTQGDHCAAVATDRGGGNVSVTNSTFTTAGSGSPLLYSTGDIQVDNITGTATGSQIAGMEGLNTILIYNSDLTSEMTDKTASDPIANGVIIYQSTSGDAETSTGEAATFNAVNSSLTSKITSGAMFYVTNTNANVVLKNTSLNFDSENVDLLNIEGNSSNGWGTEGSNGGNVTFTAYGESLSGDISVDTISSLKLFLLDSTTYTGAVSISENSSAASTSDEPVTVNIDNDSKWVVTGNSTVTNLNVEDGGQLVDENGKTVTVVANGSTVISGESDVTVTVTGDYSTTVTLDENNELSDSFIDRTDFDDYYNISTAFGENGDEENVTVQPTTEIALDTQSKSSGMNPLVYAAIGVAVIALAIAVFVIKKKKTEDEIIIDSEE